MNRSTAKRKLQNLLLRAMKEGMEELRRINHPQPATRARLRQLERGLLELKRKRGHDKPI